MSKAVTPPTVIETKTKYVLDNKTDLENEVERLGKKYDEMSKQFDAQKAIQATDEAIARKYTDMAHDICYQLEYRREQGSIYVFDRWIDGKYLILAHNTFKESTLIMFNEKVVAYRYNTGKIYAFYKNKKCFDIITILHLKVSVEKGIRRLENIDSQFSELSEFYNPRLTKELKEEFNL